MRRTPATHHLLATRAHLELDLVALLQVLHLALLVTKLRLLLRERLFLHNPEVIDLLALVEEPRKLFTVRS